MRGTYDGLVIKESDYGENDRAVTLLTADNGKMFVIAKGARSLKSKTASLCRLFTYANYEFYEKNGRRWLSGGAVTRDFFGLSSDIQGFALASYIVQLAGEITGEGVPAEDVLRMTLNTLHAIEKRLKPYSQIKCVYEIFAVSVSGFAPDMTECAECHSPFEGEGWLDVMNGRLICAECLRKKGKGEPLPERDEFMTQNVMLPIDASAAFAWRYVSEADIKRAFAFSLNSDVSREYLERATEAYVINHLERSFEALEFYNSIKD